MKKKSKNRKYKPKEYEGKTNIVNLKEFEQYSIIEINEDVSEVIDYLDRLQKESEVETLMFYLPLDEFCIKSDTPTAEARWVLIYIHFQIYSKAYKTNEFL